MTGRDRATDRAARLVIAEELGHSRWSVTTHYLGTVGALSLEVV
jgi:hypothetical protein